MRAPATPASSIASPRSTTTSALSPMRRAQSAPAAVAKRNPDSRRMKYDGAATPAMWNKSGCTPRSFYSVGGRGAGGTGGTGGAGGAGGTGGSTGGACVAEVAAISAGGGGSSTCSALIPSP